MRAYGIFVFDPALITDRGAVILKMGKPLRQGEEGAMAERLRDLGVPILCRLGGEAGE
jgi:dimethylargininase